MKVVGLIGLTLSLSAALLAGTTSQDASVETCAECHDDVCVEFKLTQHALIKAVKITGVEEDQPTCASCHGDVSQHLEEGGGLGNIFSFMESSFAQEKSQKCLNCHSGTRAQFLAGPHGKAAMDCTNCHEDLMKKGSRKPDSIKICLSCHENVAAKFKLNERHRLQKGLLSCITCHDPHAPDARERLAGFKHQMCLRCHTDKGGPYLYEHGASRIEGCTACHEVHGTPNRHMLTHQSPADLCFSCHTAAVAWHSRFDSETTNCTVCHSTIHGSNLSNIFLK